MYNNHDFKKDLNTGELGEKACINLFKTFTDIDNIIDVRDDSQWQNKDVDFIVHRTPSNKYIKIEVKTDTYTTGRMVWELESNSLTDPPTPGWTLKTQCDWLVYYFSTIKKLYILKMPELKQWVNTNKSDWNKVKSFKNKPVTKGRNGYMISPKNLYLEMSYLEKEPFCKLYENV